MNTVLRDYQIDAVNNIRQAYKSGYFAPLLVLPTGSGKTVIFCDIAERVSVNGKRVYIVVHRSELLHQTSTHLRRLGVEHGLIAPGYTISGDRVQVASIGTMVRRLDKVPKPDMLIIDEAHHAIAKSWKTATDYWSGIRLLGVTATPLRLDGRGLKGSFDTIIEGPTIKDLTKRGYLCPSVIYGPPSGVDMSGVNMVAGDFDKKEVGKRVDKPVITGCAIEHYVKICNGVPAIAFCSSIAHAEHVAEQFNNAGISSASIDGKLSDGARKSRINSLANGQIKVLTSCDIISEGTDIPVVSASILLRPTKSLAIYLQQCGRALRPAPQIGKTAAYIIDHVGNCLRHGMVDDNREWTLENVKKQKRKASDEYIPSVRRCQACFAIFNVSVRKCPQCGKEYIAEARDIKEVEGELIKISKNDIDIYQQQKKGEVRKARTLDELVAIGKRRGYHQEWANRLYNIRKQRARYAQGT